ncbi:MAG: glycosyltransferase family 4 protein [Victivallales bacterium]
MNPSQPVKILFVHQATMLGGAELSLVDLVNNLSNDIAPVCAVPDGPLAQTLITHRIPTAIVPMHTLVKSVNPLYWLMTGFNYLCVMFKLIGICRKEKIKVIHANSLTSGIYAAPVSFLCRIPLIWHERDLTRHSLLAPIIAKFATRIIAISNAVAENLKSQMGDNKKIRVIYNGIDVDHFRHAETVGAPGFPGLPTGKKTVLMAAQFVRWKRHNDFITMASCVREKFPDAVFVFAGDMKIQDQQKYVMELERTIAEKGLKKHFVWTGYVGDMPGLMQNVDCVVLPASHEPFGRIVAEAMAAGKPAVSVRSGAMSEIIEDGVSGFLTEPGDCRAMAEAVCRLLQDRELARTIGANGCLRISQEFTIQRTVREFGQLVRSI